MQDWIVEEKNLLDKNDFDMDREAIEEPLLFFRKLLKMKKFFL